MQKILVKTGQSALNQRTGSHRCSRARQRGFTMFEMMVYILAASILFAAAFNRYRDYPGEAERASFQAILAQLNSAINLQMMRIILSEQWQESDQIAELNPMDLMLTPPGNYLGSFNGPNDSEFPRRTWYFDTSESVLVYLADNAENLYRVTETGNLPANTLNFQVQNVYSQDGAGRWEGLILAPVFPYRWASVPLEIPDDAAEPAVANP